MTTETGGRRMRTRPSQSINYREETEDGSEEEEDFPSEHIGGTRKRNKNRGSKRKAEDIESLYRQEDYKAVSSTPLETIYESPRIGRVQSVGRRSVSTRFTRKSSDDKNSSPNAVIPEADTLLMTARKMKRLCLFANHYYPSKQKVRQRKERARRLHKLTGVTVPKGLTISEEDLNAVLSCLSDDETENNPNVTNNSSFSSMHNLSGFYNQNIIQPDKTDTSIDLITQNLSDLKMNVHDLSTKQGMDAIISQLLLEGTFPFSDDGSESVPAVSRDKKQRKRSGRLSRCLLPSRCTATDEKTSEAVLPLVSDSAISQSSTTSTLDGSFKSFSSETVLAPLTSSTDILEPKYLQDPSENIVSARQRRRTVRERSKECTASGDEARVTAKERTKERKSLSNGVVAEKLKKLEMGIKRPTELETNHDTKKWKNLPADYNNLCSEKLSEVEPTMGSDNCEGQSIGKQPLLSVNPESCSKLPSDSLNNMHDTVRPGSTTVTKPQRGKTHGRGRARGRARGKRRVSGINRSLYCTVTSSPNDSSMEMVKSDVSNPTENSGTALEVTVAPHEGVTTCHTAANGDISSPSVIVSHVVGGLCCSPTSPSTRMAALSINSDHTPTSSSASLSPAQCLRKTRSKKPCRRSSRLSAGATFTEGLETGHFGSYWALGSPTNQTQTSMNTGTSMTASLLTVVEGNTLIQGPLPKESAQIKQNVGEKPKMKTAGKRRRCSKLFTLHELEKVDETGAPSNSVALHPSDADLPKDKLSSEVHNASSLVGHVEVTNAVNEGQAASNVAEMPLENSADQLTSSIPRSNIFQELDLKCNDIHGVQVLEIPPEAVIPSDVPSNRSQKMINLPQSQVTDNPTQITTPVITLTSSVNPESQNNFKSSNTLGSDSGKMCDHPCSEAEQKTVFSEARNDTQWDSPVISGMYENLASFRLGKVYRNKDTETTKSINFSFLPSTS